MASEEELSFNAPHKPHPNAIEAFKVIEHQLKAEIHKSRHDWDKHEPKMWARAAGIADHDLTAFNLEEDLVLVRSAPTSYGTIILGKLRLPAIKDELGEGYIHVRIHDPPNRGTEDVKFHSLFTDEHRDHPDAQPSSWQAIQTADTPLEFFNE